MKNFLKNLSRFEYHTLLTSMFTLGWILSWFLLKLVNETVALTFSPLIGLITQYLAHVVFGRIEFGKWKF